MVAPAGGVDRSPAPATAVVERPQPRTTLVVGDSLGVGMLPHLEWRVPDHAVSWDVLAGRSTPQGLVALRARVRAEAPSAVVVSLGSNDGPHPGFFAHRVRRMLAAIPTRTCLVWPTIVRPKRKGDATGLNRVLRRIAGQDRRLVVVDWDRAVAGGRVGLQDGLHPDLPGFEVRSRLIAAALRDGCAPAGAA